LLNELSSTIKDLEEMSQALQKEVLDKDKKIE